MDIKGMTGEQIARLISGEYERLIVSQQNLKALQAELTRREQDTAKQDKPKPVKKTKEEKDEKSI